MQSHSFATATPESEEPLKLKNRLNESRSPYVSVLIALLARLYSPPSPDTNQVRGHMNNPVAWQMWEPEALALAKKHDRLLFVSIGYAACHCMWKKQYGTNPQPTSSHYIRE
jgi:Protein of unknown function, DUF255